MVQDTSIQSYKEIIPKLGDKQQEVYDAILYLKYATDHEVANFLEYSDPNKVRPRRFELVELGLITEIGRRECGITGKSAIVWTPFLDPHQGKQKPHGLTHTQYEHLKERVWACNDYQIRQLRMLIKEKMNEP